MPRYLQKKRRRWYAVLEVPDDVREHFGKPRFLKSLRTESLSEAEALVLPVIGTWKAEIEAARSGRPLPLIQLAENWQTDYVSSTRPERETLDSILSDKAAEIAEKDPDTARLFFDTVVGQNIMLAKHVDSWITASDLQPKTRDMQRSDVEQFITKLPHSSQITKSAVQAWIDELDVAPGTINRKLSAYRSFWKYLERRGLADREKNPFKGVEVPRPSKGKAARKDKRQPFAAKDLVDLLYAAEMADDVLLSDLIWLGMWTGARIEELCALKVEDVGSEAFAVADAKSEAGFREVPIHSRLKAHLSFLCSQSSDGYVLAGLTRNKYDDRSNAIGKRFGRLKRAHGFDHRYVFHSVRKTVTTLLENAGVPENVAADIVGHEKQTITYGLYSGGSSLDVMRRALEKLEYPLQHRSQRFEVEGRE